MMGKSNKQQRKKKLPELKLLPFTFEEAIKALVKPVKQDKTPPKK